MFHQALDFLFFFDAFVPSGSPSFFLGFFSFRFLLSPSSSKLALLFFFAGASSSKSSLLRAAFLVLIFFVASTVTSSRSLEVAYDEDVATIALPNTAFSSAADFVERSFAAECFLYLRTGRYKKKQIR